MCYECSQWNLFLQPEDVTAQASPSKKKTIDNVASEDTSNLFGDDDTDPNVT